jgi:hypothetical protein
MTGLIRAQCTRLIGQYRKTGRIAAGQLLIEPEPKGRLWK